MNKRLLLPCVVGVALLGALPVAGSGSLELIEDAHPGTGSVSFFPLGSSVDRTYLRLDDGVHGQELWASDGTEAGTHLVRDITAGAAGSELGPGIPLGGFFLLPIDDGVSGTELWRTDGTADGTVRVKDIAPGSASSLRLFGFTRFVRAGSYVYFVADDGVTGRELWRTDGTPDGTRLVADIHPGGDADPQYLTGFQGEVFFQASQGNIGAELWRTDRGSGGVVLVADLWAGVESSRPRNLTVVGKQLFFAASHPDFGSELFRTDGTTEGTELVADLEPGPSDAGFEHLTAVGDTVVFFRHRHNSGKELWSSDGTASGTEQLLKPQALVSRDEAVRIVTLGQRAVFGLHVHREHGRSRELWVTDGSREGTRLLRDFAAENQWTPPGRHFVAVDGVAFFGADDGIHGRELWKSDGTEVGTSMVRDRRPGSLGLSPLYLTVFGDEMIFNGYTGLSGREIWRSDGTDLGTFMVADLGREPASSNPLRWLASQGAVFFTARHPEWGRQLWITEPGWPGAKLVFEVPLSIRTVATNDSFLVAEVYREGCNELWVVRREAAPVRIAGGPGQACFDRMGRWWYPVGDRIFFAGVTAEFGEELWVTDGTAVGTRLVADIWPRFWSSEPQNMVDFGGELVFVAATSNADWTIWRSDGTPEGTSRFIDEVSRRVKPRLWVTGGKLFFSLHRALWIDDGSVAGPRRVPDLDYPLALSRARGLNGSLFFVANDGVHGSEPWVSDGTGEGTRMLADLQPGPAGGQVEFYAADGLVYMRPDRLLSRQLWKTDGTPLGTGLAVELDAARAFEALATVGRRAVFFVRRVEGPDELWSTDGTPGGTRLEAEVEYDCDLYICFPRGIGPGLYFSGDNGETGNEPWRLEFLVDLAISDAAILEGDGNSRTAEFKLTLSEPLTYEVSVEVATADVSARGGEDYVPLSKRVPIAAGASSASVRVPILGDSEVEEDETFRLFLSRPLGVKLVRSEAIATIVNDDSEVGGCGLLRKIWLAHERIEGPRNQFAACEEIEAFELEVDEDAGLMLFAGQRVVLGEGFRALDGAVVVIAPLHDYGP